MSPKEKDNELYVDATPSGKLPPGASVSIVTKHRTKGRDGAPDTGYKWEFHDGDGNLLNHVELTAIGRGADLHTKDRRDWGIAFRPGWEGVLHVSMTSEHGVSFTGRYEIDASLAQEKKTLADAIQLFEQGINIVRNLGGLVK